MHGPTYSLFISSRPLIYGPQLNGHNLFQWCIGPLASKAWPPLFVIPIAGVSTAAKVGAWRGRWVITLSCWWFMACWFPRRCRDCSCCYLLYPCWLVCILTFLLLSHLLMWPWDLTKVKIFCFISLSVEIFFKKRFEPGLAGLNVCGLVHVLLLFHWWIFVSELLV